MGDIADLEGHLERTSSLVLSYLHPNLVFRDHPIVPGQPVLPYKDVSDSKLRRLAANGMLLPLILQ